MIDQRLINQFYEIPNLVKIAIDMPPEDWDTLRNAEPHGGRCDHAFTGDRYDWFQAQVGITGSVFPSPGLELRFPSVGVKKRSYCGSFSKRKPSLALDFGKYSSDTEARVEDLIGTKHVTLNNCKQDPSYIRQPLGYRVFRQVRLPYSRCNFATVSVNENDIGLYVNIEPIKRPYIQLRFQGNDRGNLYELERGEDFNEKSIESDRINFEGFSPYEDKRDLGFAAHILADHADSAHRVIDMLQFARFSAIEILLKHWDGYANNRNNTFIYNDVPAVPTPFYNTIDFKFIPWGLDQILQQSHNWRVYNNAVVSKIVLNDPAQKERLRRLVTDQATSILGPDNYRVVFGPLIDEMEQVVLAATRDDDISEDIESVRDELRRIPETRWDDEF